MSPFGSFCKKTICNKERRFEQKRSVADPRTLTNDHE